MWPGRTSKLVASESDVDDRAGDHNAARYRTSTEPGNLEEPDPEVLSVPKSDKTGIAEGPVPD